MTDKNIKSPIQLTDDETILLGKKMDDFIDQQLSEGADEVQIALQSAMSIEQLVSPEDAIKIVADMLSSIADNVDTNTEIALKTVADDLEEIASKVEERDDSEE